jgi:hypothetical protein
MGTLSDLDLQLQELRRVMEDDMGDEPQTPKEIAQYKVEMAARDAWLATADLLNLRNDPIAREQFTPRIEGDLWTMKTRIDTIISELRAADGATELPPSNVKVFRR